MIILTMILLSMAVALTLTLIVLLMFGAVLPFLVLLLPDIIIFWIIYGVVCKRK